MFSIHLAFIVDTI